MTFKVMAHFVSLDEETEMTLQLVWDQKITTVLHSMQQVIVDNDLSEIPDMRLLSGMRMLLFCGYVRLTSSSPSITRYPDQMPSNQRVKIDMILQISPMFSWNDYCERRWKKEKRATFECFWGVFFSQNCTGNLPFCICWTCMLFFLHWNNVTEFNNGLQHTDANILDLILILIKTKWTRVKGKTICEHLNNYANWLVRQG